MAIDGTDSFSSEKISCPCCTTQKLKNGKTLHQHTAVTPVIVESGQPEVIPLPPEFVRPQDGQEKQDGELAAAKCWLNAWGNHYSPWNISILGDDLYCYPPFCEDAIEHGYHVLLVCKPDSHPALYEWIEDFECTDTLNTIERMR